MRTTGKSSSLSSACLYHRKRSREGHCANARRAVLSPLSPAKHGGELDKRFIERVVQHLCVSGRKT